MENNASPSSPAAEPVPGEPEPWCPWQDKDCEEGNGHCNWPCERWFAWHDQQAAAKEREWLLTALTEIATGYESYKHISGKIISPENPTVSVSTLKRDIESLRGEQP